jgi:hypothetical protein
LAAYIAKPLIFSWLWKAPKYEIAFTTGNKVTIDTAQSHSDLVAALTEAMKRAGVDLSERDEILTGINSRYDTAGEQAERAWLATFIPPLVLLGLGFALAWIVRGFYVRDSRP